MAGMVVALHTFGRDSKWNPHIHMLLSESAVGKITKWKDMHHIPFRMLRKRWQTTLLYHLRDALDPQLFSLNDFKHLTNQLYRNYPTGFYVNAPSKKDFNSPNQWRNTNRSGICQSPKGQIFQKSSRKICLKRNSGNE